MIEFIGVKMSDVGIERFCTTDVIFCFVHNLQIDVEYEVYDYDKL